MRAKRNDPVTSKGSKPRRNDPASRSGTRSTLAACTLLLGTLAGCGEPPPEERLADAEQAMREAAQDTKRAHRDVELLRSQVDRREQELEEAERELAEAQDELVAAATVAEQRISEVALFRAVQSALLEDDRLESVAIRVTVRDRRVILHGEVEDARQAEHALSVAKGTFGVADVASRLRVRPSRGEAG